MKKAYIIAVMASIALSSLGGVIINVNEQYNSSTSQTDVVFSVSGSLDLTGQELSDTGSFNPSISPSSSAFMINSDDPGKTTTITGDSSFGTGSWRNIDTQSGDYFVLNAGMILGFAPSYSSGDSLSATASITNSTFSSLGITPGTYTWTLDKSGDTIQMEAVPEPSVFALSGLVGIGVLALRRIFIL